jgi:hypothetical protein
MWSSTIRTGPEATKVDVEQPRAAPTQPRDHDEEGAVKYMLMIYDNPETRELFLGPEGGPLMAEMDALMGQLTASGELIGGEALADPSQTRTVRVQEGVPVVTDGPLAEAKEHFGGYLLVECEAIDRAVEIASAWPSARFSPMEVRPVMDPSGMEM